MSEFSSLETLAVFIFVVLTIGVVMYVSRTYYGEGVYTINTVLPAKDTEPPCLIGDYKFNKTTWKGVKVEVGSIGSYHVGQMYNMRHCRVGTQYAYEIGDRRYDH